MKQLGTPGSGGGANRDGDGSVTAPDSDSNGNRPGRMRGAGTTLYDALFLSSDELMSKQKGRKALIILSDGVDAGKPGEQRSKLGLGFDSRGPGATGQLHSPFITRYQP